MLARPSTTKKAILACMEREIKGRNMPDYRSVNILKCVLEFGEPIPKNEINDAAKGAR